MEIIETIEDTLESMEIIETQWKHILGVGGMGGAPKYISPCLLLVLSSLLESEGQYLDVAVSWQGLIALMAYVIVLVSDI